MERIAYIFGEQFLYWGPIVLAFGAAAAAFAFVAFHLLSDGKTAGTFLLLPLAAALSLVLGRLLHWYCRPDSYSSFYTAMTDFSSGNFALLGAMAGCLLAACLCRLMGVIDDLPKALDCMALAGALGIGVGRLSHLFNGYDRGMVVQNVRGLPLVYPVENAVTGQLEYRLATFMLQAIVALVLFAVLTGWYLWGLSRKKPRHGDACLLFLLCYGASQIMLDSTRYDSLYFRSNGFVSIEQIVGAVAVVLAVVVFSVRLIWRRTWPWGYVFFWGGIVGLLSCAGIMEYFVQRRSNEAAGFYYIMTACLALVVVITLVIRALAVKWEDRQTLSPKPPQQNIEEEK